MFTRGSGLREVADQDVLARAAVAGLWPAGDEGPWLQGLGRQHWGAAFATGMLAIAVAQAKAAYGITQPERMT